MPQVPDFNEENPCKAKADKRQAAFDRKLHGQPDKDLIQAVEDWIRKLCETGGKAWTLSVPPNPTRDPDILIGELCRRFEGQREAVDRLTNAEAILKSQIGGMEQEDNLLRTVCVSLQDENAKLKQEVERLTDGFLTLQNEHTDRIYQTASEKEGKLMIENAKLKNQIRSLREQLENRKIEVAHLGEDGEIIRTPIDVINEQQASHIAELTERYESVKKERDELRIKAATYEALIEESKAFWPKDMLKTIVDAFFASFVSKKFPSGGIVSNPSSHTSDAAEYAVREWLKKPEEKGVLRFAVKDNVPGVIETEITELRKKVAEQKDICEAQYKVCVDYKIREQFLQEVVEQQKKKIHELTDALKLEKGDHSAARIKVSNLEAVVKEQRETIDSLRDMIQQPGNFESVPMIAKQIQNADLQNRVEELEQEIIQVDRRLTREMMEHKSARVQIGNKELIIEALRAVNEKLEEGVEHSKTSHWLRTIERLQAEITTLRNELDAQKSLTDFQTGLKIEAIRREKELKREISALNTDNTELLKTVNDAREERKRDLKTVYTGVIALLEAFNTPGVDWSLKMSLQKAIDVIKSKM